MTNDEYDEFESKDYVTIDELAAAIDCNRRTVATRLKVFRNTVPGPAGARLYPREVAWWIVCAGTPEENIGPQKLDSSHLWLIKFKLYQFRLNELEGRLASLTTVTRVKREIRDFIRQTEGEVRELHQALFERYQEQHRRRRPDFD